MHGAHTKGANLILDTTTQDQIGALLLTLESLFHANLAQCLAYLLCTYLFAMHVIKTQVLYCGFKTIGTTQSDWVQISSPTLLAIILTTTFQCIYECLGDLLKHRLWLSRSGLGLDILHFQCQVMPILLVHRPLFEYQRLLLEPSSLNLGFILLSLMRLLKLPILWPHARLIASQSISRTQTSAFQFLVHSVLVRIPWACYRKYLHRSLKHGKHLIYVSCFTITITKKWMYVSQDVGSTRCQ